MRHMSENLRSDDCAPFLPQQSNDSARHSCAHRRDKKDGFVTSRRGTDVQGCRRGRGREVSEDSEERSEDESSDSREPPATNVLVSVAVSTVEWSNMTHVRRPQLRPKCSTGQHDRTIAGESVKMAP